MLKELANLAKKINFKNLVGVMIVISELLENKIVFFQFVFLTGRVI